MSPLTLALPHPPLPRRRSSLLSATSAPHTPRSCAPPTLFFASPSKNRNSTDSWTSSNGADDIEWEWKPEQVLLLSRTLDALPAHLVTPFNGPIPPSNLLDKIARGISQAKGTHDWPHSLRATRVKLIELSRGRAKEDSIADRLHRKISEETELDMELDAADALLEDDQAGHYAYCCDGVHVGARRPLYRQSSMDFVSVPRTALKDNENIARLSNRLQHPNRPSTQPYHPYVRTPSSRAHHRSSPPHPTNVPSLISPSTPSSSTLNSLSSFGSVFPRALRRTSSSLSATSVSMISASSSEGNPLKDPRIQRVRTDSLTYFASTSSPSHKEGASIAGVKRAPSFGTFAQEAKKEKEKESEHREANFDEKRIPKQSAHHHHVRQHSGNCVSSDEEEKIRSKQAKKPRVRNVGGVCGTPSTPPPDSSVPSSPVVVRGVGSGRQRKDSMGLSSPEVLSPVGARMPLLFGSPVRERTRHVPGVKAGKGEKERGKREMEEKDKREKTPGRPLPMNLQRNPSMFGAELPQLRNESTSPPASPTALKSKGGRARIRVQSPLIVPEPSLGMPLRMPSPPFSPKGSSGLGLTLSPAADIISSPRTTTMKASSGSALNPPATIATTPPPSQVRHAQREKKLRRVRRRISFGSLMPTEKGDEADVECEGEVKEGLKRGGLGSAFQLA